MTRESAPKGAPAVTDQSNQPDDNTARREVDDRVHSAAVVLAAIDAGTWPATVEIVDGVGAVLAAAARWALVAELEQAA